MSIIAEPVGSLMVAGVVQPPSRPGLLGSLDHFELLNVLGGGGMGLVFLARDTENGRRVAIKMVRAEYRGEPRVIHRFLLEARHLQKLKAPGIVPVLEVCERGEGSYFVMPYFERGSLAKRIQAGKPEDGATTLQISTTLADAISFAHRKGITHRDIKPANILLGNDGSVCLADFGLARTFFNDSILDLDRDQCEGTPAYMSPAVAAGEAEDTRCDIYSLGAVLYEMLTGQPPYQGSSSRAVRDQIIAGPPKPIREINPKADPHLTQVAEWAMARAHRDRYASMADVAADLHHVAEGKTPLGPHEASRRLRLSSILLGTPTRRSVAFIALVACLSTAFWIIWPHPRLRVIGSFHSAQVRNWMCAEPAELDRLPGKELLVENGNDLLFFSASGDSVLPGRWSCRVPGCEFLNCKLVAEVNGDGLDAAFVSWVTGTNLGISVVNANGFEAARFTAIGAAPSSRNRDTTSYLHALRFVRASEAWDKRPKLLAALDVNYAADTNVPQRALYCFDYQTGSNEWRYPVGPRIEQVELVDLDGDGLKEIVGGCGAPSNGYRGRDGQDDDSHCYVFAFSGKGDLLWRTNLSGEYSSSRVFPVGLDDDGRPQLVAWVYTIESYHATNGLYRSKLVRLNHDGHVLKPLYQPGPCITSCLPVEFGERGRTEILCADCEGFVHLLPPDLTRAQKVRVYDPKPRRAGALDSAELSFIRVGRFIPGNEKQVAIQCCSAFTDDFTNAGRHDMAMDKTWRERAEILLLDADLHVRARYRSYGKTAPGQKWMAKAADMDGDGLDEILLLNDHVEILKFR